MFQQLGTVRSLPAILWTLCGLTPLLWLAAPSLAAPPADASKSTLGEKVDGFALNDFRGAEHRLDDYRDRKLVVLAFLGTECPLAKLYGPRLAELDRKFGPRGVAILGMSSNVQDSVTELAAYARRSGIEFPILKDLGNTLADRIGAARTPEVFVLDADRIVRYHGRIDDQWGVGYVRDEPTRHDLAEALEQLLAGKPVTVAETEPIGCHIGRVKKPRADAKVTYSNQIARLLQRRCVECHREGQIGPFALTDYNEVVGWAEMIDEVVREQRMPPWHAAPGELQFQNDRRLSDEEKQLIYDWVAAGAPQGDPRELPPPREFTSGWQLPRKPDVVIPIQSTPFRIPPTGEVRYQYFRVDPGFAEEKWIEAAEILPGNHAVVHHVLCFARPPGLGGLGEGGGASGYLVGYVPGLRAEPYPKGMAKRIPAGSQLIFQVHYTPVGTEQFDVSKLGLVFADPKSITHEVQTTSAVNRRIEIPAGDDDHEENARSRTAPTDVQLLSMMPHMHVRGKSFFYEAIKPDGTKETLLDVPHYDFNWQTSYHLAEPKLLPAGTQISCVAHYDNSEQNLNNPDPTKTVKWGDQTWEEMMIGYFNIAVPRDSEGASGGDLRSRILERLGSGTPEQRAQRLMTQFDADRDGKVKRDEVPERYRRIFDLLDRAGVGALTEQDLVDVFSRLPRGGN